ncbi:MAG: hypothetical protein SGI71_08070 [Verrucomicrobiota bacterium]|nr:hypothetical protein [Verrucomicrobiota bacterium]
MPALVKPVYLTFCGIALVILIGGLVFGLRDTNDPSSILKVISSGLILAVVISIGPKLVTFADQAGKAVAKDTGLNTPLQVSEKAMSYAMFIQNSLTDHDEKEDGIVATGNATLDTNLNWGLGFWNSTMDMFNVGQFFTKFKEYLKIIVAGVMGFFLFCLLWVCTFVTDVYMVVRLFLLYAGTAILPVFIAGLGTQSYKSQGMNYILGLVAIACWPIGWALGHIGTVVLFDWAADYTASLGGPLDAIISVTNNYTKGRTNCLSFKCLF